MSEYRVRWEIDIEADNPVAAAAQALIIQRDNDPANLATYFEVRERTSDRLVWSRPVMVDLRSAS